MEKYIYGTAEALQKPKPPRLGKTWAGDKIKLWNNRANIDAQATETRPNLSWEYGQIMQIWDAHMPITTETGPNLSWSCK